MTSEIRKSGGVPMTEEELKEWESVWVFYESLENRVEWHD